MNAEMELNAGPAPTWLSISIADTMQKLPHSFMALAAGGCSPSVMTRRVSAACCAHTKQQHGAPGQSSNNINMARTMHELSGVLTWYGVPSGMHITSRQ